MIRNNKHLKPKQEFQENTVINYRNALYQGQYNQAKEERQGRGIIYMTNTHHFIVCNRFAGNKICDQALFYLSHSRYLYGIWQNNQPHGLCVLRMNEILIMTQYERGELLPGTNILFLFEKYCLGVIIEIEEEHRWSIRSKNEVFGFDQIENMIQECGFDSSKVSPSLIKFLNHQLQSNFATSFKLRLIGNQYYRYGFDNGLAIFFDDEYQLVSVGEHDKNNLNGVGYKPGSKDLAGFIEEGIFDGVNTFVFEKSNKPVGKIGPMYSRLHLSSINFKNNFITNPSEPYFRYFETLMEQNIFKDMFNQLVFNSSMQNDSFGNRQEAEPRKYEKLEFQQLQIPTFKRTYKQQVKPENAKPFLAEEQGLKNRDHENSSFERLTEKNRLEIMKKELYGFLSPKEFPAKLIPSKAYEENSSAGIRSNRSINKEQRIQKHSASSSSSRQLLNKNNLQQRIDIIIREPPPPQQIVTKSKSKKKIFELSKSVKRDYSPQLQVSPFKSRMKARIFDPSYSRSRSNKKPARHEKHGIFSKSPLRSRAHEDYRSPHLDLGLSAEKSNSSSQIANFPVTMAKDTKYNHNSRESEGIEDEESCNIKTIKLSKTNLKENFRMKEEQYSNFKKGNQVYRNPIGKGGYNQYIYEPINIKQAGNSPYVKNSSLKNLSRNKSNHQLAESSNAGNKKTIAESTPFKRNKSYLNFEQDNRPNEKYSNYKKRTGYF